MQLENKKFTLETTKELSVNAVESLILSSGYVPLRWAIVKSENRKFIIEASCIKLPRKT